MLHHVLTHKLAYALGTFAIVIASAVAFRVTTGKCPVGALCELVHGHPATASN
jgi:hypothetical protein